jgi:hypothetical protein
VATKFTVGSNLLSCRPLTQGAFSKLPCLSRGARGERAAEGEVLRRLHAVAEDGFEGSVADGAALLGGLRLLATVRVRPGTCHFGCFVEKGIILFCGLLFDKRCSRQELHW